MKEEEEKKEEEEEMVDILFLTPTARGWLTSGVYVMLCKLFTSGNCFGLTYSRTEGKAIQRTFS